MYTRSFRNLRLLRLTVFVGGYLGVWAASEATRRMNAEEHW